ncbi:MAG: Hsp20/alpha crystallin family protein [Oryzomonas sp.]|uniref:Hsp20/alpha crystallin family protein n=1 Tax=Oryzomonas sp. TaxID=2855186 RepID=UPI0028491FE4|nr:Hsp20/alpha crystallin family protein [Oryzomonas sp.]MDR3579470.1 Hsp20/alpha crystallin family protein [Oryzomonas sp.]
MKGSTHLRSVRDTGEKSTVPVTAEHVPETRGNWLETTRLPSLIDDMERMMNEVFRHPLFETGMAPFRGFLHEIGRGSLSPSVDVFEVGGNIVVKADLPGLTKDDIAVKLINNTLEISGEKKTEEKIDTRDYLKLERGYGRFSRTLRMPEGLDADHVTATFADGVLEISIPKVEDKRMVKNIAIK